MKFSVLMSIYYKEKVEFFNRAMFSIWDEQTIKPNEIVLVQDGKLTDELYTVINIWQEKIGVKFKTIPLEINVGLGDALNIGIKECKYEIIARMDTDDIAYPYRFEKQINFLKKNPKIDILSSWVSEFEEAEDNIISTKRLPLIHDDIKVYAQSRCPINHPAVIYKKSAVEQSGSYLPAMQEDYYLWIRMLNNGCIFANISTNLVNMRSGYGLLGRRRGLKYAINEFKLHYYFHKIGFVGFRKFLKNAIIRFFIRLMPISFIKKFYFIIRETS